MRIGTLTIRIKPAWMRRPNGRRDDSFTVPPYGEMSRER